MLIHHQWGSRAFTWLQLNRKFSRCQSIKWVWILHSQNYCHISQGQWVDWQNETFCGSGPISSTANLLNRRLKQWLLEPKVETRVAEGHTNWHDHLFAVLLFLVVFMVMCSNRAFVMKNRKRGYFALLLFPYVSRAARQPNYFTFMYFSPALLKLITDRSATRTRIFFVSMCSRFYSSVIMSAKCLIEGTMNSSPSIHP